MVCTICKFIPGNEDCMFSHCANNCPFMKTNICTNCFQTGHTPKYCTNRTVFVSAPRLTDVKRQCPAEEVEQEMLNRIIQHENAINKITILNGGYHGACTFCKNSRQYNPQNRWMNNHVLQTCPRLALVVCRCCGNRGHTDKKCPQKNQEEIVDDGMELDDEFILDFGIYDDSIQDMADEESMEDMEDIGVMEDEENKENIDDILSSIEKQMGGLGLFKKAENADDVLSAIENQMTRMDI